jgi:hypothetical protein
MKLVRFLWSLPERIGTMSTWAVTKSCIFCIAAEIVLPYLFWYACYLLIGDHFHLLGTLLSRKIEWFLGQQVDLTKTPQWVKIMALSAHERFVLDVCVWVLLFLGTVPLLAVPAIIITHETWGSICSFFNLIPPNGDKK